MPAQVTNLLLVEDNPADARLLREALAEIADSRFEITHCETLAQAREFLTKNASHVILSDLGLPDCQGLEAIRHLHNLAPGVPIVVLTALNEESFGSQALQE